jgi:hypothetical protein
MWPWAIMRERRWVVTMQPWEWAAKKMASARRRSLIQAGLER